MAGGFDITVPAPVTAMARALAERGHDAILVGGAVRDVLMAKPATDVDLVTDATPEQIRELVHDAEWAQTTYPVGERFGTIGVVLADRTVAEVSRYRAPALESGRAAERFAADAGFRDFTANALGYDLVGGVLLDPTDGRTDIEARVLRAPGDPEQRFAEDPLRVLRAARFVAELGFAVEPQTRAAMPGFVSRLREIATERVRDELTRLLVSPAPEAGLRLALETGALASVLPEVAALEGVTQPAFHDLDVLDHTLQTVSNAPADPAMRWAALLHDVGKVPARSVEPDGRIRFFGHARMGAEMAESICARLRMSKATTSAIVHLVAEHMRLGELDPSNERAVDRAVRKLDLWDGDPRAIEPLVSAEDVLDLTLADFAATAHREAAPAVRRTLGEAVAASRARGTQTVVVSPVSGTDLMRELGVGEGIEVGTAKDAIEKAIESGQIPSTDREKALDVARRAVAELRGGSE